MTITELIAALEEIRLEFGELEVVLPQIENEGADDEVEWHCEISDVEVSDENDCLVVVIY